jgi:hypothetical protein
MIEVNSERLYPIFAAAVKDAARTSCKKARETQQSDKSSSQVLAICCAQCHRYNRMI